jgi:hypothetical protein
MARLAFPLIAALGAVSLAAGCAADGPYPSLAQRPAERAYAEERDAPDPPPPYYPDDPTLAAKLQPLVDQAEAGRGAFDAAYSAAAPLVAKAGASGSDSWIVAQQAVSRVTAAQAQTTRALADLDQLAVAQAAAGPLSETDAERLRQATSRLQGLADAQAERLAGLEASLRRR